MDFWAFLQRCKTDWRLLGPLLGAAALGIGFGWYYYWEVGQFNPDSHRFVSYGWWPLVSDSPNAVLLWVAAVLAHKLAGWRHWALDGAAFALNVYVGLWTTTVFLLYPETMRTFDWASVSDGNMNPVLFVSHMGMPLLGLALVPDLRRDAVPVAGTLALLAGLAIYLFVDYWGPHLHPAPFLHDHAPGDAALHAWAPALMAATALALVAIMWRSKAVRG